MTIGQDLSDRDVQLEGPVPQFSLDRSFSMSELISRLSHVCPLLPGDLIFTGTPAGVGVTRTPARLLTRGSTLTTTIQGLGEMRTALV